jgi:hypothetical protein
VSSETFESNRLAELPIFLNGPEGRALAAALGKAQDAEVALLRVAALSRLPFWCPDDALDAVGTWLLLPRFPEEPNGTAPSNVGATDGTRYRGRLCKAWPTWLVAGSKDAITESLKAWGLPDVAIENDYQASPPFAGRWWSRFRIKVGPGFGSFGWGAGNDPTPDEQHQMVRQVLFWKWVHGLPVEIVLDDGAGYTFTITITGLIGHGFIIGKSKIGGFDEI